MDETCASRIFATFSKDGTVSVRYISQHTGHDPSDVEELQHLRISAFTKRKITMQLLNHVDEMSIVRSMNHFLRDRNERERNVSVR